MATKPKAPDAPEESKGSSSASDAVSVTQNRTYYVYSTATSSQLYTQWAKPKPGGGPNSPIRQVLIRGGANVADKRTFLTPKGVVTPVSADELAFLKNNEAFKRHVSRGFLTIHEKEHKVERVVKDMEPKDKSAQIQKKDYENAGKKPPVTSVAMEGSVSKNPES